MKRERSVRTLLYLLSVMLAFFATVVVQGVEEAAAVTCPQNMTSYWMLDETSGAVFLDSVGGHDAVCTDCPDSTTGKAGNALLFNGVDDAVNVPADASFNWGISDSFTIEFWTKTDSTNLCIGNQVIVGRDDNATNLHWWVGCWHYSGVAAFRLKDKIGTNYLLFGSTPLNDGKWHHVAAVRNGTSAENSLFVDGRLEGSGVVSYNAGFGSATAAINMGWLNRSPFYHFSGTIDEVALYDRALTETEIHKHYLEGAMGYCTDDPPVAPQITSTALTTAYQGWPYVYNVDATGNPAPAFSLTQAPAGMTIDAGSGVIQWTPDSTANVTVAADNSEGVDSQAFTITVLNPALCPTDISHYWKLNETAAGSYADVRWANSAFCTDCPAAVAGHIGNAQQFDAVSRVSVKNDNTFDWRAIDSFSVELWMKTDPSSTCSGTQVLVGRNDSATKLHWWVGCSQNGGYARFYLVDTGGSNSGVSGTKDLTDGLWHHIVATRDASAGTVSLYVDGVREGSPVSAVYAAGFDSRTAPVNIGWLNVAPYYHFVGTLDDVAVYDRVLSDREIYQHSLAGAAGKDYCDTLAPVIKVIPDQTGTEFTPFTYSVIAYGNPAPTYDFTVKPTGMTIDATTGVISWTPDGTQAGANTVTVRATNSAGASTETFIIDVADVPIPRSLNITAVNGHVTKDPDRTMYSNGENVTLTAFPDLGYVFTGWTGDITDTLNPITFPMDGNKNITANFAPIDHWSMITPGAGAKVQSGQDYVIQWTAPPQAVNFKVLYSMDNGVTWTLIKKNHTARTLSWSVPLKIKDKTKCRIKVVGFTNTGAKVGKVLADVFTIEGTVKVLTPNGDGDLLTSGSPYPIQWQTLASVDSSVATVILQFTKNGGTTWKTITSLPELPGDPVNPGSYSWTVPDVPGLKTKCKVMVVLKNAAGGIVGKDVSDAFFSIRP